jgi:hypothetical protein
MLEPVAGCETLPTEPSDKFGSLRIKVGVGSIYLSTKNETTLANLENKHVNNPEYL